MNPRTIAVVGFLAASCVVGTDASNCNELSCDGCCDSNGACRSGTTDSACGGGGAACASCSVVGRKCIYVSSTVGRCSSCGDGTCDSAETCGTCSTDCGVCPFCGDKKCLAPETCSSCPGDCGACVSGLLYDRCNVSADCKTSNTTCVNSIGGTAMRCRQNCSTSTNCSSVSGYSADTPYCASSGSCYLSCPSVGSSCPYGAQCKLRSDNTCCACL